MTAKQPKNQMKLAFPAEGRGEAPKATGGGTEAVRAGYGTESPASPECLMEEVCQRDNLVRALKRVKANQGSPGIDGMRVEELADYLKEHWPRIREQMLQGAYQPQPVKRVKIPKPGGGERPLGIPTVLDRFIPSCGHTGNLNMAADFSLPLGTARRAPTKYYLFGGNLV